MTKNPTLHSYTKLKFNHFNQSIMLGKRSRPATIGMRTGPASSAELVDSSTSPSSPLDCRILSPRSPKHYDQQGGVGLGIVVALNNNNDTNNFGGEILAKYALCSQFSCRSIPIPMNNNSSTIDNDEYQELDDMFDEEFTYVTCHGPDKTMTTRVYYNGADYGRVMGREISSNLGVFTISSPGTTTTQDRGYKSDSDFLSSCHLCRKTLHGKDIFMYRGEKAFCSTECRQSQICIEERKEQCSTSANVYGSTRDGHILSPGIMAR